MDILIARGRLKGLSEKDDISQYDNLPEEDYKAIFNSIEKKIPFQKPELRNPVSKFLYYGALKFDKFSKPTPYAVNKDQLALFESFLDALRKQDGCNSVNTPVLELHRIKRHIYDICNFTTLDNSAFEKLKKHSKKVEQISAPVSDSEKFKEFDQQKTELISLISGLSSNSIYTKIKTILPYKFANKTSISLKMNDVDVFVSITPHFTGNRASLFKAGLNSRIETLDATRWQSSFSEIEIKIDCLIDDSKSELPLTLPLNLKIPALPNSWNFLYKITYEIIEKLWWQFKLTNIETSSWAPIPKDIPYIEFSQWNNDIKLDYKLCSNPSDIYTIKPMTDERIDTYKIGNLDEIEWTKKSYIYAKLYIETGQYKEALFWLNVATESLIEHFIDSMVVDKELKEQIFKEEPIFESAEEILSAQFPEMKGIVEWPKATKHPTIYYKIKNIIELKSLPLNVKEVKAKYSIISKDRNTLFHGSNTNIDPSKLKKAFEAYDWLEEKFSSIEI